MLLSNVLALQGEASERGDREGGEGDEEGEDEDKVWAARSTEAQEEEEEEEEEENAGLVVEAEVSSALYLVCRDAPVASEVAGK